MQVCLEPLRLPVDSGGGGGGDETVSSPQQPGGAARVEVVVMTACNHAFHMDCIRNLASPLCPVCRYNHDSVSSASVCSEVGRGGCVQAPMSSHLQSFASGWGMLVCHRQPRGLSSRY